MSLIVQVNNSAAAAPQGVVATSAAVPTAAASVTTDALPPPPPTARKLPPAAPPPPAMVSLPSAAVAHPPPLPTVAITSIAEQQQQQQQVQLNHNHQQHIVQHHPPPLGPGDTRLRMIQVPHQPQPHHHHHPPPPPLHHQRPPVSLPQSPVRQSALPPVSALTARPHPRLPHSPIRQHAPPLQLPQQPVTQQQLQQGVARMAAAMAANRSRVPSGPPPGVIAGPPPPPPQQPPTASSRAASVAAATLSMLPNAPAPPAGLLPTGPSPSLLPQSPATLIPFPTSRANLQPPGNLIPQPRITVPSTMGLMPSAPPLPHYSSKILMPSVPHHNQHLMPPAPAPVRKQSAASRRRNASNDEIDVAGDLRSASPHLSSLIRGSGRMPSPRGRAGSGGHHVQHPGGRFQCIVALQDHNYASRPPPTPPPASPPPPPPPQILTVPTAHNRHPSSVPIILPPDHPQLAVAPPPGGDLPAAYAAASQHPLNLSNKDAPAPPPPPSGPPPPTHVTAMVPPPTLTREQRNNFSMEEAGVGPMKPLEDNAEKPVSPGAAVGKKKKKMLQSKRGVSLSSSGPGTDEDEEERRAAAAAKAAAASTAAAAAAARSNNDRRAEDAASGAEEEEDEEEGASSGGEETETAPEEAEEDEGEDESITRCICDFLHDDGYMIFCDMCSVWQHVVCMGLDKNNIPDEYLCEVCKPRPVDRKKARAMQAKRRSELFNSSNDDSPRHGKKANARSAANKKMHDRKAGKDRPGGGAGAAGKGTLAAREKNNKNKQYRKRKPSEKGGKPAAAAGGGAKAVAKQARRKSAAMDNDYDVGSGRSDGNAATKAAVASMVDSDDEEDSPGLLKEPTLDASQQLRSWIDQYEEAVTNHYSPELRARLVGAGNGKINGISQDLRPSVLNAPVKSNVSLKGNGVKILTASTSMSANTPIIECKGKLMISSQLRGGAKLKNRLLPDPPNPYVFFYRLSDSLEICLDGKTYGNDARFCRRAHDHNAELRHVMDKGSLHLFIVAKRQLDKNQEILLPPETERSSEESAAADGATAGDVGRESLQSINADLREISKGSKPNGVASSDNDEPVAKMVKKKQKLKKRPLSSAPPSKKLKTPLKVPPRAKRDLISDDEEEEEDENTTQSSDNEAGLNGESGVKREPATPNKGSGKPSPAKLGLPDNSGLIVGVDTINYDASSSLRNKAKSREERKMEMIMKQIEALEKAEQKKKEHEHGGGPGIVGGGGEPGYRPVGGPEERVASAKRKRRSSSATAKSNHASTDSAMDVSSAEEGRDAPLKQPKRSTKTRKKGGSGGESGKSGPPTPQRRRSRVLSGSASVSENEGGGGNGGANSGESGSGGSSSNANGPFRFPKTKKMMMSDWLQADAAAEAAAAAAEEDDDVSASYLKGNRSPPGIATHLLRAAPLSPAKSVSAKKRWLRQAISEDQTEESAAATAAAAAEVLANINGCASPSETVVGAATSETGGAAVSAVDTSSLDYVTPLKKRRLASYKDDTGSDEQTVGSGGEDTSPIHHPPQNNLKKKLLQNRVLEAVLDKAMEDMLGPNGESGPSKMKVEDDVDVMSSSDETKENNDDHRAKRTSQSSVETKSLSSPPPLPSPSIRHPEQSSVFKSFFKSDVSLEELEARLEASKRQREASLSSPVIKNEEESAISEIAEERRAPPERDEVEERPETVKVEESQSKPLEAVTEDKFAKPVIAPEAAAIEQDKVKVEEVAAAATPRLLQAATAAQPPPPTPPATSAADSKPKEKRRVSLADYKRRRTAKEAAAPSVAKAATVPDVLSSTSSSSSSSAVMPSATADDGSATPTLDEQLSKGSAAAHPTLSTLPLFEKLEKLEQAQQETKKKASSLLPEPEPKREDLTERLKKEFGLVTDDESADEQAQPPPQKTELAPTPALAASVPNIPPPPPSATHAGPVRTKSGSTTPEVDSNLLQHPPPPAPVIPNSNRPATASGAPPAGRGFSGAPAYPSYPGSTIPPYPGSTIPPYPGSKPLQQSSAGAPAPPSSYPTAPNLARPPPPPSMSNYPPPPRQQPGQGASRSAASSGSSGGGGVRRGPSSDRSGGGGGGSGYYQRSESSGGGSSSSSRDRSHHHQYNHHQRHHDDRDRRDRDRDHHFRDRDYRDRDYRSRNADRDRDRGSRGGSGRSYYGGSGP